ncbi:MAG: SpoIIE family protein phosphatase [Solirubrobacteraceae bacterium MAG38_C4-C5]|nr:SpoIIE family protein phosphatase [Candidatus Siliceabacter maunaloa]
MLASSSRSTDLLREMVRILAGAETLRAATNDILVAIGTHGGWQFGTLWTLDGEGLLRCEGMWQADAQRTAPLARASLDAALPEGTGLPGATLAAGEPVWMYDLAHDPRFLRGQAAAESGLRSGLAFPIVGSDEPLGVMEFLSEGSTPSQTDLLDLVVTLGRQVGQYIERRRVDEAMRVSETVKDAIVRTALDAIVGMDGDGRVLEWNPAAERTFGFVRDEALGRVMADLIIPPTLREPHRRGLAHHLATGETRLINRRIEITAVRRDGTEFPVELSITRQDFDAQPRFTGYLRDLTGPREMESELRRSRDELEAILEAVADSVTARGPDGDLMYANPAALAAAGKSSLEELRAMPPEELLADLEVVDEDGVPLPPGQSPYLRVLAGEDEAEAVIGYRHPDRGETWMSARSRAIRDDGGRLLMALTVARDITARKREEHNLRHVADTLQAAVLPRDLPAIPGVEMSVAFTPRGGEYHDVGGDYYDAFGLDDECWLVTVGDVRGKGAEAAAVTSLCRYSIRALSLHHDDPAALLGELNEVLLRHCADGRFATAALARLRLNADTVALSLALGGHPCPLLLRADGRLEPVGAPGTLLGVVNDRVVAQNIDVTLGRGDALVFYTDGVPEARDSTDRLFDLPSYLAGCRGWDAEQIACGIQEAAIAHQGGRPDDDVALLVLRVPEEPLMRRRLPAVAESVVLARHALDELVDRFPRLDWDALRLVVGELVTNSIVHGTPRRTEQWFELTVTQRQPGCLRFAVADPAPVFIARRHEAAPEAESGRGIFLLDSLADRWGTARHGRACIWFERDLR